MSQFIMVMQIRITISHRSEMNKSELRSIKLPFSLLYAWVTVLTVFCGVIAYLKLQVKWLGYTEVKISYLAIGTIVLLTILYAWQFKDILYSVVILWTFIGILIKLLTVKILETSHQSLLNVLIFGIALILLNHIAIFIKAYVKKKKKKRRRQEG
jgi:hypothetical protein